ncbi:AAA family ATPase [Roseomonas sp. E05]|uniref:AAA family ATPase n=1 Tax=Roseomonas sp. E05 TaxID=3046310 RepID=UPI0024BAC7CC|nr:AAA family ATPase [Roseomonas sp. E05]MDJ0390238.1 AAA family ATPase [Roseomonas sp. E05]
MTKRLKSISVRDFRSIRGEITVSLDAPVVLIHGQNGAGKTSILSALELGLTGSVTSLRGLTDDFASHLLHKQADEGRIVVTAEGIGEATADGEMLVRSSGVTGAGLLSPEMSRFFTERCYLSQATLGRLLELYQVKDTRKSDSPLTKFVKDLLGLDSLDALIDGLHDSGDVRRFRNSVPAFWNVRESIPDLEKKVRQSAAERKSLEAERTAVHDRLRAELRGVGIDNEALPPAALLERELADGKEESELQRLARLRREAVAIRQQWLSTRTEIEAAELEEVETSAKKTANAIASWRSDEGQRLEHTLLAAAELLPSSASLSTAGTERAHAFALDAIASELNRCEALLARDAEDASRLAALDQDLGRAQRRLSVLEEQLAAQAVTSSNLAQALSGILSHIHTEDCPVCGRDFQQVSDKPLQAHVSERIAALTESAGRLQALSRERAEAVASVAAIERDRGGVAGRQLAPSVRDQLKSRRARLEELNRSLEELTATAMRGRRLAEDAAEAARTLDTLRARDQQAVTLRDATHSLAQHVGVEAIGVAEALEDALDRIDREVVIAEERLVRVQEARRSAQAALTQYIAVSSKIDVLAREIVDQERRLERFRTAKEAAETRITQSRELARRAREARTKVVQRVFNDSLNAVWRDLFVRLAPEEPFVPAFALPEGQSGPVEALLETHYRSGGRGGDPRAMLSAGNLNTAALTLFLALHLSVKPTLPWLIIDDPVQSMDEVHIAQLAALLRTLSKQHGRQVIIAVHERPLFEYLAFELSPAFPNDRLITVELGRSPSGATIVNFEPLIWRPDTAIAA